MEWSFVAASAFLAHLGKVAREESLPWCRRPIGSRHFRPRSVPSKSLPGDNTDGSGSGASLGRGPEGRSFGLGHAGVPRVEEIPCRIALARSAKPSARLCRKLFDASKF